MKKSHHMRYWMTFAFLACCGCQSPQSLRLDAEIRRVYADDPKLYNLLKIVNTGRTEETILTAGGISSGWGDGTEKAPHEIAYGLSVERQTDSNGFVQVCSPALFQPVRLRPGEYADITTGEESDIEWLNAMTGTVYFVFHYDVTQDWGRRLNVWHGRLSSKVIKVDFDKEKETPNRERLPTP